MSVIQNLRPLRLWIRALDPQTSLAPEGLFGDGSSAGGTFAVVLGLTAQWGQRIDICGAGG